MTMFSATFTDSVTYKDFGEPFEAFVDLGFDTLGDLLSEDKQAPLIKAYLEPVFNGFKENKEEESFMFFDEYGSKSWPIETYWYQIPTGLPTDSLTQDLDNTSDVDIINKSKLSSDGLRYIVTYMKGPQ